MKNIIKNTIVSNMTSFTGVNRDGEGAGAITTDSWRESQMSNWNSADMLVNNTNMAGGVREEDRSDRTIFVHGTFSNPTTFSPEFKKSIERLLGDPNQEDFKWSGDNINKAREVGAENIDDFIKNYEFAPGEPLNIVGHSHGGNVIKLYSNLVDGEIFGKNGAKPSSTTAYLFATPNLNSPTMKEGVFDKYYNIYNKNDILTQDIISGTDTDTFLNIFGIKDKDSFLYKALTFSPANDLLLNRPFIPVSIPTNPSQTTNEANSINIGVDQKFNINPISSHKEMKNQETVNEIYNFNSNKHNETIKNLEKYENFMNFINKK